MRTVKAKLEADVAGFKAGVDSAAQSVDGLDDKVDNLDRSLGKVLGESAKAGAGLKGAGEEAGKAKRSFDDLDDKVEDLDRSLKDIPADAAKAAAAMALLKGDVSELDHSFEAVGDRSTAFTILEQRIGKARTEVKKLTEEFVKTGDVDVFKKLGAAQGDLSFLEGFRKKMSSSVENGLKEGVAKAGPESANTFASLFQGGVIKSLSNPYVLAAASALAVALGAFVLAAVGGAIIAAGAAGVAGAGAAGAFQQSELVKKAWNGAIDDIQHKWMEGSKSFIGPMIDGANTVRKVFAGIDLQSMFSKASTFVKPLSEGAAWFARNVISGVDALVERGGPVIDVLRQELPELGDAIASALTDISSGNKGAADGLRDLFNLLEKSVRALGVMVEAAEKMYGAFTSARDAVGDFFGFLDDHIPVLFAAADAVSNWWPDADTEKHLTSLKQTEEATKDVGKAADRTAEQVKQIDSAFSQLGKGSSAAEFTSKILDSMFKLQDATLDFEDSLNKLDDSVKKNGTSLDIHTDKGMSNARAVIAMAKANAELYESNLASGMSAADAAKHYDEGTKRLEAEAKAAGFNSKQVQDLIGQYRNVPAKVQTLLATIGLTDAVNKLAQVLIDFRNLDGRQFASKYTVTTTYKTVIEGGAVGGKGNTRAKDHLGGVHRRAAQGLVIPPSDPGTVLVAEPETGGEVNIPFRGISQMRAMNLMQTVGDGYGLNVQPRGGGGGAVAVQIDMRVAGTNRELGGLLNEMYRRGDIQFVVK